MCGICGLVRPLTQQSCPFPLSPESQAAREELPAKSQLESMLAALHHRGPDARGAWTSAMGAWQLMLGHTRLAILDRSELAHQPQRVSRFHQQVTLRSYCERISIGANLA
jgi:asparagine synthetase B (glutamine-hydrolysing)